MHDPAAVADELPSEPVPRAGRHELRGLELLSDHERLRLRAASSRVVALEREKDDESEQDCEAGCEHAEHAGCAVTVLKAAPLGRSTANEEHRSDGERGHTADDEDGDREIHATGSKGCSSSWPGCTMP